MSRIWNKPLKYFDHFLNALDHHERCLPSPSVQGAYYMALVKDEVKESLKGAKLDKPNPELVQMTLIKFINWTIEPNSEDFKWMDLAILCWL